MIFFLLFFRDLVVCMKRKHFIYLFIFNVLTKLGILIPDLYLYSIKIQTNIDQNAVTYLRKITIVFEIICEDNIFFFRAGPNPAHVVGLDPAGLAGLLAQTSDPAGFIPASMREYVTHTCYNHHVIKF